MAKPKRISKSDRKPITENGNRLTQAMQNAAPESSDRPMPALMAPIHSNTDLVWADQWESIPDPDPIAEIAYLLEHPPVPLPVSEESLREIVEGKSLMFHLEWIEKGFYLNGFLANLDWWASLTIWLIARGFNEDMRQILDFEKQIGADLDSVLSLYTTAWGARELVGAVGSDPTGLELLKRRMLFRDRVVKLAGLLDGTYLEVLQRIA